MLTQSQKKLYFVIISSVLLFVMPIVCISLYFINNRAAVIPKTINSNFALSKNDLSYNQELINGTYPITFIKPGAGWNYRVLRDNADFGKINTLVFEIFKDDVVMRVNIVEENITELRQLERNGDQKIKVLDSVLEYKESDINKATKVNNSQLIRVNNSINDKTQIILSTTKQTEKANKISYLQSLDLFPEFTVKYRNSRLRTKISYLPSTEENYNILDKIIPSLKLVDKNINP
jgi:hypothetical protein